MRTLQEWERRTESGHAADASDKLFVHFASTTVEVLSRVNGEVTQAQIFGATPGCSNYTYVQATPDQKIRSWIGAHVRALAFFGAVLKMVVCDNLKALVRKSPVRGPPNLKSLTGPPCSRCPRCSTPSGHGRMQRWA